MGFKDLAAANEIAHLELPLLLRLVADKKKMTIFGSDSITREREGFLMVYVMTVQIAIAEQWDDLDIQLLMNL